MLAVSHGVQAQISETEQPLELAPWDNCSGSQKTTLRRAERLAKYIIHPDIINPVIRHLRTTGTQHWIVERFFDGPARPWTTSHEQDLVSDFSEIRERILEGDVQVKCRDCDANARVFPFTADRIAFCPGYFSADLAYQAAVWIHELSHELFRTRDTQYGEPPAAVWDAASRRASYDDLVLQVDPQRNAESYEAATLTLIGEHFDELFRQVYGKPITGSRFDAEIADVGNGANYRNELMFADSFLNDVVMDRIAATEADIDVIREHFLALGGTVTRSPLGFSRVFDPLATKPSMHAVRQHIAQWGATSPWSEQFYRSQFAAKFVVL
jgi:hypothetical protein